jgi:hypothetical protein
VLAGVSQSRRAAQCRLATPALVSGTIPACGALSAFALTGADNPVWTVIARPFLCGSGPYLGANSDFFTRLAPGGSLSTVRHPSPAEMIAQRRSLWSPGSPDSRFSVVTRYPLPVTRYPGAGRSALSSWRSAGQCAVSPSGRSRCATPATARSCLAPAWTPSLDGSCSAFTVLAVTVAQHRLDLVNLGCWWAAGR